MSETKKSSAAEMAAAYAAQLASQEVTATSTATTQQQQQQQQQQSATWDAAMMMQYMQALAAMGATEGQTVAATDPTRAAATAAALYSIPWTMNSTPTQPPPPPQQQQQQMQRLDEGTGPVKFLWVGGLPSDATEEDVERVFGRFGRVDGVKLLPGKNSGFLRYENISSAIEAHEKMPGTPFRRGTAMTLRVGWGKTDPFEDKGQISKTLWIGNIVPETTQEEIANVFCEFGTIELIKIVAQKKCAFVSYSTIESARRAKQKTLGRYIHGSQIKVNYGKTTDNTTAPQLPAMMPMAPQQILLPPSAFITMEQLPIQRVEPPHDKDTQGVIDKFAAYVLKNGKSFEESAINKQATNPSPKLAFLNPMDETHQYYKWKIFELWDEKRKQLQPQPPPIPPHHQFPPSIPPPIPQQQQIEPILTMDEQMFLSRAIETISPTKESIKTLKDWIVERSHHVNLIIERLRRSIEDSQNDFQKRLSILYLMNDILHVGLKKRASGQNDEFINPIQNALPQIARMVGQSDISEEDKNKVIKVFDVWETRHIFPSNFVLSLKDLVSGANQTQKQQQQQPQQQGWNYPNNPPQFQPPQQQQQQPSYFDVAQMVGSIRNELNREEQEQEQQEQSREIESYTNVPPPSQHNSSYQQQQQQQLMESHKRHRGFDVALPYDQDTKRERKW